MATLVQNLQTRRDAIGVELAALSTTGAGGLPNASGPNAVDHVGYKDGLYRELETIDKLLEHLNNDTSAGGAGPTEIVTEGYA